MELNWSLAKTFGSRCRSFSHFSHYKIKLSLPRLGCVISEESSRLRAGRSGACTRKKKNNHRLFCWTHRGNSSRSLTSVAGSYLNTRPPLLHALNHRERSRRAASATSCGRCGDQAILNMHTWSTRFPPHMLLRSGRGLSTGALRTRGVCSFTSSCRRCHVNAPMGLVRVVWRWGRGRSCTTHGSS